jgi:wyosine [tRNA(Phe)-imidazoG37] synthetase (radical SAM superfamily)
MCAAVSLPLPSPTCSECGKHEFYPDEPEIIETKFELVLARLSKLKEKTQNETMTETSLVTENNKMADAIEYFKGTVADLREENDGIKTLVEIKQNEWIQIESRQSSNKPRTTAIPPTTIENRFAALTIKVKYYRRSYW